MLFLSELFVQAPAKHQGGGLVRLKPAMREYWERKSCPEAVEAIAAHQRSDGCRARNAAVHGLLVEAEPKNMMSHASADKAKSR